MKRVSFACDGWNDECHGAGRTQAAWRFGATQVQVENRVSVANLLGIRRQRHVHTKLSGCGFGAAAETRFSAAGAEIGRRIGG